MKKFIYLITLFFSVLIFAQNKNTSKVSQVPQGIIDPIDGGGSGGSW